MYFKGFFSILQSLYVGEKHFILKNFIKNIGNIIYSIDICLSFIQKFNDNNPMHLYLNWLSECISTRLVQEYPELLKTQFIEQFSVNNEEYSSEYLPKFDQIQTINQGLLDDWSILPLGFPEKLVFLAATANHLYPEVWRLFFRASSFLVKDRGSINFGLVQAPSQSLTQASVGTALFLLAGSSLKKQETYWQLFLPDVPLRMFLDLPSNVFFPDLDTPLRANSEYLSQCITGKSYYPSYGPEFPATPLKTSKTWDDLILPETTSILIDEAKKWVKHYDELNNTLDNGYLPGYRLLMAGPSGTGKTSTAALLGQEAGKPVYRIDISNIVDKYVGETSKRLSKIFDLAEKYNWILFFDEGDALFGKRTTKGGTSNERYANQEVSYLLYKLEEYQGMIFLATNHLSAIDTAFERRFDSIVKFTEPDENLRAELFHHFFIKPCLLALEPDIFKNNWRELSEKLKVNAAWIEKFYHYCLLQTIAKEDDHISAEEMRKYIYQYGLERGHYIQSYDKFLQPKTNLQN